MLPMLATLADAPLRDPNLVYEPKYDGIRALATVDVGAGRVRVGLASRQGNDKTVQFPEVVAALEAWGAGRRRAAVLDGEIVALDQAGKAVGFQRLQDRIHLTAARDIARLAAQRPVAMVVFDLLRDGDEDLCALPLAERRRRLEVAMRGGDGPVLRLAPQVAGDGAPLLAQAEAEGWEGLIVKDARSLYRPGQRTRDWRKLKLTRRQEFVVGGWTEPRRSRAHFGSLLLGLPDGDGKRLRYVGHSGGGFTDQELSRLGRLLAAREIRASPFTELPATNERPHWARPELVVEVKFSEWTDEGLLRHPIYLGLRDDVAAADVRREERTRVPAEDASAALPAPPETAAAAPSPRGAKVAGAQVAAAPAGARERSHLVEALLDLERGKGGGTLELPGGVALEVTNLRKPFWPGLGITKGELLRYYVGVSPQLLPVVRDRPLVMRRFPDGIDRPAFYQHRVPDQVPPAARAAAVPGDTEAGRRMIGGALPTLLYMAQLGAISQDPWFSRLQSPAEMDFAAIDLDPMQEAPFSRVVDVARWVREELDAMGVEGFPKTSGASGLHIYLPMRRGTPYQAGLLFCQIVATLVARRHARAATVERMVERRAADAVYVDYLQNIQGKTLACAYSARASVYAGASTPLDWDEVDERLDPREHTIRTLPERVRQVGDHWARFRRAKGIDLDAALERARTRYGRDAEP
jgi:bifunctional non-homologous end joining protein LigD